MPRTRSHSPRNAVSRWTPLRWLAALLAPGAPLLLATLSELTLTVDIQRLLLLLSVAAVGVLLGARPAMATVAVATLFAGWDAAARRWIAVRPTDAVVLAVFALTGVGVALAAGARRGASARARDLKRQLAEAERVRQEREAAAERLAGDVAALRAATERRERERARELAEARATADRAERARRELLERLSPEQRAAAEAAHEEATRGRPPAPLQLFPPIFTGPPLGQP